LKLAPLLAQYLYTNKRLDLPGIGTFLLDPSVIIEQESSKHGKPGNMEGISFENSTSIKEAADLIQFISAQTGKMKALAAADLDSHLELAQQFLNIGKPFLFEGIGSLVKTRSGQFTFASDKVMPEKLREYSAREISATSSTEESFTDYKNIFSRDNEKVKWRKPFVFLLLVAGVFLAIWGGYTVYKRATAKNNSSAGRKIKKEEIVPVITSNPVVKKDSASVQTSAPISVPVQNTLSGAYKFVLETAKAKRAFERYAKLKAYQWNVQMETKDSITYKLFLRLPVAVADTTRVLDSLTVMNGRKVFIEH
jgi:hypothetical protein